MDGTLQRYKCHKIHFSTAVHKTSLLYKCTQNQFTVQVYTKLVYWLIMKGMYMDRTLLRNVHGRNITKVQVSQNQFLYNCTQNQFTIHYTSVHKTSLVNWFCVPLYSQLVLCTLFLSLLSSKVVLGTHTHTHTDRQTHLTFALLELLLRS